MNNPQLTKLYIALSECSEVEELEKLEIIKRLWAKAIRTDISKTDNLSNFPWITALALSYDPAIFTDVLTSEEINQFNSIVSKAIKSISCNSTSKGLFNEIQHISNCF